MMQRERPLVPPARMNHLPSHHRATRPAPRFPERGFSLVEVVIAMFVLATVVTAAAFATVSSDSIAGKERAASQKAQIARKALERVEGDLAMRDACNAQIWRAQDTTGTYGACGQPTIPRFTMTDSDNRRYNIDVTVRPVDRTEDGTGRDGEAADADRNTRDQYDTHVRVTIDPGSTAGLSPQDASTPYDLEGQVDWSLAKGSGSVRISVCALDRPDRSAGVSQCNGSAAGGARPIGGVRITLTPQPGASADATTYAQVSASVDGVARFTGVAAGTYDVTADSLPANTRLHRISPQSITVDGTAEQDGAVLLSYPGSTVMVCARIVNPDIGWGYEYRATNVAYHQIGGEVVRMLHFGPSRMQYNQYSCQRMVDPLGYRPDLLFRGQYGIEAEEHCMAPFRCSGYDNPRSSRQGLALVNWGLDSGCGYGSSGSGTTLSTNRVALGPPAPSFTGPTTSSAGLLYTMRDDSDHTICLDFWSQPIYDEVCEQLYWTESHTGTNADGTTYTYFHQHPYSPPQYPSDCREFPPQCLQYCPAGETRCIANCNNGEPQSAVAGNPGGWNKSDDTQFAYGPNDGSVPCRTPKGQAANAPYNGSVRGWPYATRVARSTWNDFNWIGEAYGSGRHADGSISVCTEIGFAFSISRVGPGKEFQFGDCIEMKHNGNTVRGKVWDYGPLIGRRIQPSIAAWSYIYPSDNAISDDYYGARIPALNGGGWPEVDYRHIRGDTVCQSANGVIVQDGGGPVMQYFPPVMSDPIWKRPVDLPFMFSRPPRPDTDPLIAGRRAL